MAAVRSFPPEEVLDAFLYGLRPHAHWLVLEGRLSHAVVDVLVLLEHAQLHLCLPAHGLSGRMGIWLRDPGCIAADGFTLRQSVQ